MTEQPFLGRTLLIQNLGKGSRKGDLNIVCSTKQAGQLPAARGCSHQQGEEEKSSLCKA